MTEQEILARLKKTLSPARFNHSMSVARWARQLAQWHGVDPAKAYRAGLLHDCAKEMPGRALAAAARRGRLRVPGKDFIFSQKRYHLFHAHVSAALARRVYGERDKAVLSAVAKHTLGADVMSPLDKVLYVADFSSPDRRFAAAKALRRVARLDLQSALRGVVRWKISHVLATGQPLHPQTVSLWNRL